MHFAKEWSKFSQKIRKVGTINKFKSNVLKFIRLTENLAFAIDDIDSTKLLARLRLNFSYLNEHNFMI